MAAGAALNFPGRRNDIAYLSFGTQAGHYGQGGGLPPTGFLESGDIDIDADGCFELVLSSTPHEGNWLPMTAETGVLVVRQTFAGRVCDVAATLAPSLHPYADIARVPSFMSTARPVLRMADRSVTAAATRSAVCAIQERTRP